MYKLSWWSLFYSFFSSFKNSNINTETKVFIWTDDCCTDVGSISVYVCLLCFGNCVNTLNLKLTRYLWFLFNTKSRSNSANKTCETCFGCFFYFTLSIFALRMPKILYTIRFNLIENKCCLNLVNVICNINRTYHNVYVYVYKIMFGLVWKYCYLDTEYTCIFYYHYQFSSWVTKIQTHHTAYTSIYLNGIFI